MAWYSHMPVYRKNKYTLKDTYLRAFGAERGRQAPFVGGGAFNFCK